MDSEIAQRNLRNGSNLGNRKNIPGFVFPADRNIGRMAYSVVLRIFNVDQKRRGGYATACNGGVGFPVVYELP